MSNLPPPPPPSSPPPMGAGGPPWQGPGPGPGPGQGQSNGLGVAALIVGLLGFLLAFPLFPLGGFLGVVAIILGVIARGKAKRGEASNRGVATAGLVLGVLAVLVALAVGVVLGTFLADNADKITDCAQLPEAEQQACVEQNFGE